MLTDPPYSCKSDRHTEFRRLRDLIHSSFRPPPTSLSSTFTLGDHNSDCESVLHYDVREPDSLMGSMNHKLQSESSELICIASNYLWHENHEKSTLDESSNRKCRGSQQSQHSQTLRPTESENLQHLVESLLPEMETELAVRDNILSRLQGEVSFLLSRISTSIMFIHLRGRMHLDLEFSEFYVVLDHKSMDVYNEILSQKAIASWPVGSLSARVSAKRSEVDVYFNKNHFFSMEIGDVFSYKKMVTGLRLAGVPISLVEVPREVVGLEKGESKNPRRMSRGE
jgi:hypothetical protein